MSKAYKYANDKAEQDQQDEIDSLKIELPVGERVYITTGVWTGEVGTVQRHWRGGRYKILLDQGGVAECKRGEIDKLSDELAFVGIGGVVEILATKARHRAIGESATGKCFQLDNHAFVLKDEENTSWRWVIGIEDDPAELPDVSGEPMSEASSLEIGPDDEAEQAPEQWYDRQEYEDDMNHQTLTGTKYWFGDKLRIKITQTGRYKDATYVASDGKDSVIVQIQESNMRLVLPVRWIQPKVVRPPKPETTAEKRTRLATGGKRRPETNQKAKKPPPTKNNPKNRPSGKASKTNKQLNSRQPEVVNLGKTRKDKRRKSSDIQGKKKFSNSSKVGVSKKKSKALE